MGRRGDPASQYDRGTHAEYRVTQVCEDLRDLPTKNPFSCLLDHKTQAEETPGAPGVVFQVDKRGKEQFYHTDNTSQQHPGQHTPLKFHSLCKISLKMG